MIYGKGKGSISLQSVNSNDEVCKVTFHEVICTPAMKATSYPFPQSSRRDSKYECTLKTARTSSSTAETLRQPFKKAESWRLRTVDDEVPKLMASTVTSEIPPRAIDYKVLHRRLDDLNKDDVIRLNLVTRVKIL
jgi:hypothetical protein